MSAGLLVAALGFSVLAACGSSSPAEVIVEPGITAIREANALACNSDLANLQLAVEAFATLNAAPPTAESELVPDWLRAESELYDLVDGQIVPAPDSGCPAVDSDSAGAAPEATAYQPASENECLADFKTLQVAVEAYYAMNGTSVVPTEQALVDAGLVRGHSTAYDVDAVAQIVAVPGEVCDGVEVPPQTRSTPPVTALPADAGECAQQHKVLEVAMEAYLAATGSPAVSEADLLPEYLRSKLSGYDIVDGAIVPAPGSTCPPA